MAQEQGSGAVTADAPARLDQPEPGAPEVASGAAPSADKAVATAGAETGTQKEQNNRVKIQLTGSTALAGGVAEAGSMPRRGGHGSEGAGVLHSYSLACQHALCLPSRSGQETLSTCVIRRGHQQCSHQDSWCQSTNSIDTGITSDM